MRRHDGLLLYMGMADAYAMACEFVHPQKHADVYCACGDFSRYVSHPTHTAHRAGFYTDDTEMSCANARVLIRLGTSAEDVDFADAYVAEFARGGRRVGYSRGLQAVLEKATDGVDFLDCLGPPSAKNGAAMRAVPFGVLPKVSHVLEMATRQARITHDTSEGRFSARAVALMAHYALYEPGNMAGVLAYCLEHLPPEDVHVYDGVFRRRWDGGPVVERPSETHWPLSTLAVTTVHAVADLVAHQTSLTDMLFRAIRWGGDTDSVAAVAWGIASARFQDEPLPAFLERDLDGGAGAAYLRQLGAELMDAYGAP